MSVVLLPRNSHKLWKFDLSSFSWFFFPLFLFFLDFPVSDNAFFPFGNLEDFSFLANFWFVFNWESLMDSYSGMLRMKVSNFLNQFANSVFRFCLTAMSDKRSLICKLNTSKVSWSKVLKVLSSANLGFLTFFPAFEGFSWAFRFFSWDLWFSWVLWFSWALWFSWVLWFSPVLSFFCDLAFFWFFWFPWAFEGSDSYSSEPEESPLEVLSSLSEKVKSFYWEINEFFVLFHMHDMKISLNWKEIWLFVDSFSEAINMKHICIVELPYRKIPCITDFFTAIFNLIILRFNFWQPG